MDYLSSNVQTSTTTGCIYLLQLHLDVLIAKSLRNLCYLHCLLHHWGSRMAFEAILKNVVNSNNCDEVRETFFIAKMFFTLYENCIVLISICFCIYSLLLLNNILKTYNAILRQQTISIHFATLIETIISNNFI